MPDTSITEQFDFARKALHPLPRFPWEVDRRTNALVDRYAFFSRNEIVSMGDDLLLRCPGYTVAGRQTEEYAFIRRETCTGMTFHNAGKVLAKTH